MLSINLLKSVLTVVFIFSAFFVAFILTLSSYSFLVALLTFFITSSRATKFRQERKRKLEENFKEGNQVGLICFKYMCRTYYNLLTNHLFCASGGQRNWIQVLCNGGMATQLALLYLLDLGSGERVIDFYHDYRGSWLNIGVLGKLIAFLTKCVERAPICYLLFSPSESQGLALAATVIHGHRN